MKLELTNTENEIKQPIVLATHKNKLSRYSFIQPKLPLNELLNSGKPMEEMGSQGTK